MKRNFFLIPIATVLLLSTNTHTVTAQTADAKIAAPVDIEKLKAAVEANPDDLAAHTNYLKGIGFSGGGMTDTFDDTKLVEQYSTWMKKFPKSAMIPYALGHGYAGKESPKARPYLLKAVEIDPKFDKAYFDLWIDGERWGDFKKANEYLLKAAEAAPQNADYAFYYISTQQDDPAAYAKLSLDLVNKFPKTERAAQALYWLSFRTQKYEDKIRYYEQLKQGFSINKSNWAGAGLGEYFDLLLSNEPAKALTLCEFVLGDLEAESRNKKVWDANLLLTKQVIEVNELLLQGKSTEAIAIMDKVKVPRFGNAKNYLYLLKSKSLDAAGQTQEAYKKLLLILAKEPSAKMIDALDAYGTKLGKNKTTVAQDIKTVRDTSAKIAPDFALENYYTGNITKLSDLKGKVILVTYWFPGCGPCRGEFPHFENVVKKFKDRKDFAYLGINIVAEQDEYVLPFMKSSGYSFIPLKDNKDWKKGPLDNRGAAPVNFLIDGDTRKIIFSDFRTNENNEDVLEMMISSMLQK